MKKLFCKKCGGILMPKIVDGKKVWVCAKCKEVYSGNNDIVVSEVRENVRMEEVSFSKEKEDYKNWPITYDVKCPECGNNSAYYNVVQTRAADEAPTIIYVCTKCKAKWREYG